MRILAFLRFKGKHPNILPVNLLQSGSLVLVWVLLGTLIGRAQQYQNISFLHDGKTIYGTLSLPAGSGKFPVVVLAPGSGPNNRDGELPMTGSTIACLYPGLLNDTLRPYRDLALALTDSGYAVLRYDKLEYTYPTNPGVLSFHKLWLPFESALTYVKTRPDIDTNRIILIGHSEGSSLIPLVAKTRNDIKALISLGGPRTPLDSLMAWQIVNIAQTCGGNVPLAQLQAQQILDYFEGIRTQTWTSSTPSLFGVPPAVWYDYVLAMDPVADHYNQCNLPVLFVGMGDDINVPPSELIRFQNDITVAADFLSIPGLTHYMTPAADPYVSTVLTDTLIWWLRQHQFATGVRERDEDPSSGMQVRLTEYGFLTVQFSEPQSGRLFLMNTCGQLLDAQFPEKQTESGFCVRLLPKGIYFLGFESEHIRFCRKWVNQGSSQ